MVPARRRRALWALLLLSAVLAPASGQGQGALAVPPADDDAERHLGQARQSRLRLEFADADAHLDAAVGRDPHLDPAILAERGLLARDRGDLDHALTLLRRAADTDPSLPARVDAAGVLVQLGRWPEAIVVLRQAFDERGTSLPVDEVTGDKRFVRLAGLRPYQEAVEAARAEQAGPFGRVLVRLERLQVAAARLDARSERAAAWFAFGRAVLAAPAAAVAVLLLAALAVSGAATHLRLAAPPVSLGLGLGVAALGWSRAASSLSGGTADGRSTIGLAALLLVGAWGSGQLVRLGWRRYRAARLGAGDPFAADHLPDTLMVVDEVSRLGHRLVGARRAQQRVLVEALRQAGETLRDRLERGA